MTCVVFRGPADVVFRLDEKLAAETNRKANEEGRLTAEANGEEPVEMPPIPTNHKFAVAAISNQALSILSTDPISGY